VFFICAGVVLGFVWNSWVMMLVMCGVVIDVLLIVLNVLRLSGFGLFIGLRFVE